MAVPSKADQLGAFSGVSWAVLKVLLFLGALGVVLKANSPTGSTGMALRCREDMVDKVKEAKEMLRAKTKDSRILPSASEASVPCVCVCVA